MENNKLYRDLRTGDIYRCVIARGRRLLIREHTVDDESNFTPVDQLYDGDVEPPRVTVNIAPIHDFVEEGNCG